jgi:DNA-binding NarL/FixJ family response regulator
MSRAPSVSAGPLTVAVQADRAEDGRRVARALGAARRPVIELPGLDAGLGAPGIGAVVLWPRLAVADLVGAIRELRARTGDTPMVVVMPSDADNGVLRKALRAGADGLIEEDALERCLDVAVEAVCRGMLSLPRRLRPQLARQPLSHREKQILGMVVMGFTNRQIADELYLAESTVKTHLSSAFSKLQTRSRAEATALILDPDEGLGPGILAISDAGDDGAT